MHSENLLLYPRFQVGVQNEQRIPTPFAIQPIWRVESICADLIASRIEPLGFLQSRAHLQKPLPGKKQTSNPKPQPQKQQKRTWNPELTLTYLVANESQILQNPSFAQAQNAKILPKPQAPLGTHPIKTSAGEFHVRPWWVLSFRFRSAEGSQSDLENVFGCQVLKRC